MVWIQPNGSMRGNGFSSRRIVQRFRQQLSISTAGSIRIKLLLCTCLFFTVLLFTGRLASFMGWKHHEIVSPQGSSAPRVLAHRDSPIVTSDGKGYTILMNTWKRNDLLKKSISHYISCPGLDSIHIVWSEPDPPSQSLRRFLQRIVLANSRVDRDDVDLKFDFNKEDSLNNRFKEIKDLKSDAIFSIDDDVIFPCSSVEFAFNVWQSAPDAMVGFVPRAHWIDQSKDSFDSYTYGGWWSVWWTGTYSMVLSKAAFFHKKYLDLYTNQMPASIRDYVSKNRNCEDIAMAFLVANATRAPPIWVKGKIFEIGSSGISSLGGHTEKRSKCVNDFAAEFGHMPLVSTTVKAVDSRHVWFW